MDVLSQFLSFSNLILCLVVVGVVWALRKFTELLVSKVAKKDLKEYKLWSEFAVPLLPLCVGALLMLVPALPIPVMFAGGLGARIVFGIGLGLISGLVFRVVKKMFVEKLGGKKIEIPYLEE